MKEFSRNWVSSKKPNKQRKYRFNAPLNLRGSLMNVHLSKDLRQKYTTRALRVRTGDKVRIMRGQFKGQEGKIEEVNMKTLKVYITKIEHVKRDGSKARYPIQPSNLMIVELNTDDKKRLTSTDVKPTKEKVAKPIAAKPVKAEKKETAPKVAKVEKTEKPAAKKPVVKKD